MHSIMHGVHRPRIEHYAFYTRSLAWCRYGTRSLCTQAEHKTHALRPMHGPYERPRIGRVRAPCVRIPRENMRIGRVYVPHAQHHTWCPTRDSLTLTRPERPRIGRRLHTMPRTCTQAAHTTRVRVLSPACVHRADTARDAAHWTRIRA